MNMAESLSNNGRSQHSTKIAGDLAFALSDKHGSEIGRGSIVHSARSKEEDSLLFDDVPA
jgi:hypothetical protein